MRVFLIDFENMRSEGLRGIDSLSAEDTVVIFYSNNADTLSFAAHAMIMSSKANIVYYKIKRGGKNALDFQLITCLGYMLAKEPEAEYFVISKDTGYDFAIEFWADNFVGVNAANISRCYTIRYAINRSLSRKNGTSIEPEEEPLVPETDNILSGTGEDASSPDYEETEPSDEAADSAEPSISEAELEAYENGAFEEEQPSMNSESVSPENNDAAVSENGNTEVPGNGNAEVSENENTPASEITEQTSGESEEVPSEAKPAKKTSRRRPARKPRSRKPADGKASDEKNADEKASVQPSEHIGEKTDQVAEKAEQASGNTKQASKKAVKNAEKADTAVSENEETASDESKATKKPSHRRPARRRPAAKKKAPVSEE